MTSTEPEMIQVVMTSGQRRVFEKWLAERRHHLIFIPSEREDDLPTYVIGIDD